ncbi:MAG: tetratricopeptide repeat protein [Acidobacteria bacterium]|nr:tetratricopeptide repeat protein [Acidobacteriota bacterium]
MRRLRERIHCIRHRIRRVRPPPFGHACCVLFIISRLLSAQIEHIQTAARFLNDGQMAEAEAEARQALAGRNTRPLALAMLGTIRLQAGKYDESTNFLIQALALNPNLVGARTTLGDAYLLQGKPQLAERTFRQALKLDPSNFNARFDLVKVEASLHNFQESLEVARPILPRLLKSEESIQVLATDYGALGKKQELRGLIEHWQHLPSPNDESSLAFGELLNLYGMKDEGRNILDVEETRIAAHPSAALALRLGNDYLSLGVLTRAERNSQLALSLAPDCSACYQTLAQIAERQDSSEKALAYLMAARKQDPENPEILFDFGKLCLKRNLVDDALPALTKAVALKPDEDSYVYVLGSANVASGNLPNAAKLFGRLLEKHPRDAILNYAIGAVHYLEGKYTEAETSLKQSLAIEPDQIAASYYLALTYDAIGDDERAIPIFRNLVSVHPQHAPSYVKLGGVLVRRHQYDEARQDLERGVSLDPESVEAHYQLGVLLRRLGKTEESENQFAQSRKLESEQREQKDLHLRLLLPD